MARIWDQRFAFLVWQGSPVVIGEMGLLPGEGQDLARLRQVHARSRHWRVLLRVEPGPKDTGGLIKPDWQTPETAKLDMLSAMPSTDVPWRRTGRSVHQSLLASSAEPASEPISAPPNPSNPPSPHPPPSPPFCLSRPYQRLRTPARHHLTHLLLMYPPQT